MMPGIDKPVEEPREITPIETSLGTENILVVDDEVFVTGGRVLESAGYIF